MSSVPLLPTLAASKALLQTQALQCIRLLLVNATFFPLTHLVANGAYLDRTLLSNVLSSRAEAAMYRAGRHLQFPLDPPYYVSNNPYRAKTERWSAVNLAKDFLLLNFRRGKDRSF